MKKSSKIKLQKEKIYKNYTLLDDALDQFYKHCIIKNLTERSLKYYRDNLEYFTQFKLLNYLNDYTEDDIGDYILFMRKKDLSDATINLRLRSVKTFFKFCLEKEYLDREIKVKLIKEDEVIKECYTKAELEKLLVKPKLEHFHTYRNWVIINFLLATGCRASTLVNIKKKDIDFEEKTIIFRHTKNRKQQIIPLPLTLENILKEYLDILDDVILDDSYVFCSQFGTQLSVIGLQQAIRRYNLARGVNKTSVHLFRHTACTNMAKMGMSAFKIQQVLGHSTLKMTNKYTHLNTEDFREEFDNMCILNKLNK